MIQDRSIDEVTIDELAQIVKHLPNLLDITFAPDQPKECVVLLAPPVIRAVMPELPTLTVKTAKFVVEDGRWIYRGKVIMGQ